MVSRVAKNPIKIPVGVNVKIYGQLVTIQGKLGELTETVHKAVKVTQDNNKLQILPTNDLLKSNALGGTTRAIIQNMIRGVHQGFQRKLIVVGVGYRVKAKENTLQLTVGFSHPVNIEMPEGISVETPSLSEIIIKGTNWQMVSQVAANIRAIRPPEPYKGKGIRYNDEHIVYKEAKKK